MAVQWQADRKSMIHQRVFFGHPDVGFSPSHVTPMAGQWQSHHKLMIRQEGFLSDPNSTVGTAASEVISEIRIKRGAHDGVRAPARVGG
jgi:hypothetical protein